MNKTGSLQLPRHFQILVFTSGLNRSIKTFAESFVIDAQIDRYFLSPETQVWGFFSSVWDREREREAVAVRAVLECCSYRPARSVRVNCFQFSLQTITSAIVMGRIDRQQIKTEHSLISFCPSERNHKNKQHHAVLICGERRARGLSFSQMCLLMEVCLCLCCCASFYVYLRCFPPQISSDDKS